MKKLLIVVMLVATNTHADTVERCRVSTAGDKVCEVGGKITQRCHTSTNGTETCRKYGREDQ